VLRCCTARRDELTAALGDAPAAPDTATLDQIADHLDKVIATGTPNQCKALVEALVAGVTINGPDRLIPVFRIPNHGHETGPHAGRPGRRSSLARHQDRR
jgi:site-specific DNA recombinase